VGEPLEIAGRTLDLRAHPRVWAPTSFARTFAPELLARVERGARVLELGVGSGVLSILAGLEGAEVTALDINPDALELAAVNWAANGLPARADRFRHSDRFAAVAEGERFDLVFSNPPVLPAIGAPHTGTRDDFEVAGEDGRRVLDAMLERAGPLLAPGGRMLTIATSLQGWPGTEQRLKRHWGRYRVVQHHTLALTEECGPAYLEHWHARSREDGLRRVYEQDAEQWHDVWILEASEPR